MSLIDLKSALASAKSAYQTLEQDIRNYGQEKLTQEARLRTLKVKVAAKQKELGQALTQESSESLTVELNELKSQQQACETLIQNISNYLKDKASNDKTKASRLVEGAQKNLLLFVHQEIKTQLDILTDEQKELLKDFVVINKMISGDLPDSTRSTYHLGCAFDSIYGELKGNAFTEHQSQMLKKYTA